MYLILINVHKLHSLLKFNVIVIGPQFQDSKTNSYKTSHWLNTWKSTWLLNLWIVQLVNSLQGLTSALDVEPKNSRYIFFHFFFSMWLNLASVSHAWRTTKPLSDWETSYSETVGARLKKHVQREVDCRTVWIGGTCTGVMRRTTLSPVKWLRSAVIRPGLCPYTVTLHDWAQRDAVAARLDLKDRCTQNFLKMFCHFYIN